ADAAAVARQGARGDSSAALGRAILRKAELEQGATERVPGGLPLSAQAQQADEVQRLQANGSTNRQRGDGGGLQGGVHAALQRVGDDLVCGGRRGNLAAASGRAQ